MNRAVRTTTDAAPAIIALVCTCACSGAQATTLASPNPAASAAASSSVQPAARRGRASDEPFTDLIDAGSVEPAAPPSTVASGTELEVFRRYLGAHANLTYDQVRATLPARPYLERLDFDPSAAQFYDETIAALHMTDDEKGLLRKQGFVSVDQVKPYSMSSIYFAVYTRDLPVLITSDSLMLALHRSYDGVLTQLEDGVFMPTLAATFGAVQESVATALHANPDAAARRSLRDLDLYVTVARNLLAGAGAEKAQNSWDPAWNGQVLVPSQSGQDADVLRLLQRIRETTMDSVPSDLYGRPRKVDWSQFKPRGHYTSTEGLRRYFRTMMWLGRADLGFEVKPDGSRELRDAAAMALVVRLSGQLPRIQSMSKVLELMVGQTDSVSLAELDIALTQAGVAAFSDLGKPEPMKAFAAAMLQLGGAKNRIRSSVLVSNPRIAQEVIVPRVAQLFGQRFGVDSFVLSKVVYDSILFQGEKQRRTMPAGLDVFAALGNDEAISLLEAPLREHKYGSNLLAARAVADSYAPGDWSASLYHGWLDALRSLDDPPPTGAHFPKAMQTRAWQHKQLQTQLASWAELRRDTILYSAQSYGASTACEYPTGYVEPYPAFFTHLETLGKHAAYTIGELDVSALASQGPGGLRVLLDHIVAFWKRFAATNRELATLATKELAGQPFTTDELRFLKQTINVQFRSSGAPRYDGWYPKLFFGGAPAERKPTIADVHTDPISSLALEEATGDPTFLVVAIDNRTDHTVYVGPVSTYYEFTVPTSDRMTDEQWVVRLSNAPPARPSWVSSFQARATPREMDSAAAALR